MGTYRRHSERYPFLAVKRARTRNRIVISSINNKLLLDISYNSPSCGKCINSRNREKKTKKNKLVRLI
ncbi:MAG: hypothetical protein GX554_04745 [Elusimicrobia bacterium]|nr:hypothetical protein [Elusimicrobiota bacterium]